MQQVKEVALLENAKRYYDKRDYTEAERLLNELIAANDSVEEAYFYLANILHIRGDIGKAIKHFQKVLSINPNHTDAAVSLSVLFNDIGHYESAKKVFDQASERVRVTVDGMGPEDNHINKKFSFKHYEIAELYMSYGRFDEALFEYNKATKLDPANLEARIKIAKVYAKKGFLTKAFDELRKLKNENPAYHPARLALGVLYYGSGRVIEAQQEWENIVSRDPHNSEAKMYLNLSKTATETRLS